MIGPDTNVLARYIVRVGQTQTAWLTSVSSTPAIAGNLFDWHPASADRTRYHDHFR